MCKLYDRPYAWLNDATFHLPSGTIIIPIVKEICLECLQRRNKTKKVWSKSESTGEIEGKGKRDGKRKIRKSNNIRGKYNQVTLYACTEMSDWNLLLHIILCITIIHKCL
jgi:hypothetical protein